METGLVLSRGRFRGIAHFGAINVHITHIAGTRVGAIAGTLYAQDMLEKTSWAFLKPRSFSSSAITPLENPVSLIPKSFMTDS